MQHVAKQSFHECNFDLFHFKHLDIIFNVYKNGRFRKIYFMVLAINNSAFHEKLLSYSLVKNKALTSSCWSCLWKYCIIKSGVVLWVRAVPNSKQSMITKDILCGSLLVHSECLFPSSFVVRYVIKPKDLPSYLMSVVSLVKRTGLLFN